MNHGWLRILHLGGCAAILSSLMAGCGSSNALEPNDGALNPGSAVEPVGETYYGGWVDFPVTGSQPVHVLKVTVLGVPHGLTVVGTYAVSMKESNNPGQQGHYIGGGDEAHIRYDYPNLHLRPVTDAVFPPGNQPHDWYLMVALKPTEPGVFATTGLRVDYESGGQTGSQTYSYKVTVRCAVGATLAPFSSPRPSASP